MKKKLSNKLKEILKPTIIKVSLWLVYFGFWNFIIQTKLFTNKLLIVPCRIFLEESSKFTLCSINPTVLENTLYFGFRIFDLFYLLFFLIVIYIGIPYFLSGLTMYYYNKFFHKD
jgi:hypothetical protein